MTVASASSDVPPGLLRGSRLSCSLHRSGLSSGLTTLDLDRNQLTEGLAVGITESEIDFVDLAVSFHVRAHSDRESKRGIRVTSNFLFANKRELLKRNELVGLLASKGNLAITLI